MEQRIPDINLVEHEGDFACAKCSEEAEFLIGPDDKDRNLCKDCFAAERPEFSDALNDFAELFILLLETKNRMMSQDDMHELYGNDED
jgi:hypothetical protein